MQQKEERVEQWPLRITQTDYEQLKAHARREFRNANGMINAAFHRHVKSIPVRDREKPRYPNIHARRGELKELHRLTIRVDAELLNAIKRKARANRRSYNSEMRLAIRKYIQRGTKGL